MNVDTVVTAYIECALWLCTDDADNSLSDTFDRDGIDPDALAQMEADCADFVRANAEQIEESGLSAEQIGHNFWLSRNNHGAGFWDRGLGDVGNALDKAAEVYGECTLYVGDDGALYL